MGMKRTFAIAITVLFLWGILPGCAIQTAAIDISNVKVSHVWATVSSAYYLSNDGVLYCSGADSDASSYVVYENPQSGIVAKDVMAFNEMVGGGYYIDSQNRLFIWNEKKIPFLDYHSVGKRMMVKEGIVLVKDSKDCFVYIDANNDLYFVGRLGTEQYSHNNPKFLDSNVVAVDIREQFIIWSNNNGNITTYGTSSDSLFLTFANKVSNLGYSNIQDIVLSDNYMVLLADNELLFCGNYPAFISGESAIREISTECLVLASDIQSFSCSTNTIVAIDNNGRALLWGKCLVNGLDNTTRPQYGYFEKLEFALKATSVSVSGNCLCYVDTDGVSHIYHAAGWPAFYGNSTSDVCVGIGRSPNTWS